MNYKVSKLTIGLFCLATVLGYVACQKAVPAPYSNPPVGPGTGNVTIMSEPSAVFQASISSGPTINFAPAKSLGNGQVQFIGTNATYTINISFPNNTGPGQNYFISGLQGFSAYINNGADQYSATYHGAGGGILNIDSISHGKYYGSFHFVGQDPSQNNINVTNGVFSNL